MKCAKCIIGHRHHNLTHQSSADDGHLPLSAGDDPVVADVAAQAAADFAIQVPAEFAVHVSDDVVVDDAILLRDAADFSRLLRTHGDSAEFVGDLNGVFQLLPCYVESRVFNWLLVRSPKLQ